jgi:hypothetical protein
MIKLYLLDDELSFPPLPCKSALQDVIYLQLITRRGSLKVSLSALIFSNLQSLRQRQALVFRAVGISAGCVRYDLCEAEKRFLTFHHDITSQQFSHLYIWQTVEKYAAYDPSIDETQRRARVAPDTAILENKGSHWTPAAIKDATESRRGCGYYGARMLIATGSS